MRKFSKILESIESDLVLDIKDILMDFKDVGFQIDVKDTHGTYTISMKFEGKIDVMECIQDITVANNRLNELGLSYQNSLISMNSDTHNIVLMYKKNDFLVSKDIHGWEEFKSYCQNILGIDGMEGNEQSIYFRINVVDKDNGWPTLTDDMAGWSIEVEKEEPFVAQFPGYESFLKKLLSRQINYSFVWHLVSREGDRYHYISDPVKLAAVKKEHNPMKFDKEGIEAVETLLEMAEKFPGKIKINKYKL